VGIQSEGSKMGYTTPEGYGPLKGLEGPFSFRGRVLYYDPMEGKHWDPKTDFYVSNEEMLYVYGLKEYD
jgi:hypothetical protein